jgi:hypothetical protein
MLGIESAVQGLVDQEAVDQAAADLWLGDLKQRDKDSAYLSMILGFTVAGRKVAGP